MRLYNTIVVFDVYCIANTQEAAVAAAKAWIKDGLEPTESVALESREEKNVRQSWRDQKPLVGTDVSDKEFEEQIKGHTTIEIFTHLYQKR